MYSLIKSLRSATLVGACAFLLGACGLTLEKAQNTSPPSSPFEAGLHSGYLQLSESEYSEADYRDSDVFADRVIATSNGASVTPEELGARNLPEDKVSDLSSARQRLVSALDATARDKVPGPAARAQVMFDCWMQEQEENFQPGDIQRCRSAFESAMAEVEDAMRPPAPEPVPAPAQPAVPPPADISVAPRFYTIFFDFDSAEVNDVAARVIAEIVNDWGARDNAIALVGHTDSSGSAAYNLGLSQRRATSVGAALQDGGIGGGRLSESGVGESDLAVPTGDGVRESRNRRVTVVVE